MRFFEARSCRSAAWRGVFLSALVLVGMYVVFDILDLDGSQSRGRKSSDIIVAASQQIEAERFTRVDLATPISTHLTPPSLSQLYSTALGKVPPAATVLRSRQNRLLPRVDLHREQSRTASPTADPA